jgi:hypothetical protein
MVDVTDVVDRDPLLQLMAKAKAKMPMAIPLLQNVDESVFYDIIVVLSKPLTEMLVKA